jgi:hypothetical protein
MLSTWIRWLAFVIGALIALGGFVAASSGDGSNVAVGVEAIGLGAGLMVAAVVQRGRYRSGEAERTHAEPGTGRRRGRASWSRGFCRPMSNSATRPPELRCGFLWIREPASGGTAPKGEPRRRPGRAHEAATGGTRPAAYCAPDDNGPIRGAGFEAHRGAAG